MSALDTLKESLIDDTKDLRLNLGAVLGGGSLEPRQRYLVALASALFLNDAELAGAIREDGAGHLDEAAVADAKAAASIMAMNTVYYRFRHMIGKEAYSHRQAGLRMGRMARPATDKATFELASMACAALAGCEACIKAHEEGLIKAGAGEEKVHDAVRIGAVVRGFQTALVASRLPG
ncbi:carboxymuconolactone decarboxylase family protein [Tautonia plasticadhaerens]|uniref:Alkyl hydroperoxide reductase AhpD n=1 Tax=Tautonia plasticadhaerens TaxID=2527974 RepID=A0A518HDK6_9BACT|nr:carboxymuconolactone decarboxylase family protein [Tautonia plasticadhaerens]QDV38920.1 Alkyl hydroperoxide reductase AhpD [Tautonia plasticadhaerens]